MARGGVAFVLLLCLCVATGSGASAPQLRGSAESTVRAVLDEIWTAAANDIQHQVTGMALASWSNVGGTSVSTGQQQHNQTFDPNIVTSCPASLAKPVAELCRAVHKMRNETKFPLNTLDPPLSQGKNPRPKAPERTPLGDSELDKSVLSLGRRDARYRGGDEFGQKHSGDRALLTPSASAASMQVHAGSSSQTRSSTGRHFGAPSPSGSLGEGVGAVGVKLESRLSRVDEVGMSGHDVAAPTQGLTVTEDAATEPEASSAVSTPDRESVESLSTHAGKEAGVKGVLDAATLRLAAAVFSGDAPADGSQSSLRRTGEGAGWMGPCQSIDDFLDGYGLWEIRDKFVYHGIDDMQVVLRLTSTHIARVTDRVGMQVRLEDAVTRERQLSGFASHLPGSACSTPALPSRHLAQPSPD